MWRATSREYTTGVNREELIVDPGSSVVLMAKTRRPNVEAHAISRVDLIAQLDSAVDHPLTLMSAPAGFGKTWLVADWLETNADLPQCWVTVDRYDNDPMRLWRHMINAVDRSAVPAAAAEAIRLLDASSSGLSLITAALARGLAECAETFVIVLDDAHRVDGDDVLRSLDRFIALLPDSAHVILVGRHDPSLPLAKRRLTGKLLEFGAADLRCSPAETEAVVTQSMGLDLDPQAMHDLHRMTMGWMAGIRLTAAAAARERESERIAPDLAAVETDDDAREAVREYIAEEVLDESEPADRQFLLDTSIVGDLSGPLCVALTGRSDSDEVLARQVRRGMFMSVTDEKREWYRYHDLFREALQDALRLQDPDHALELHRRAALWLREDEEMLPAIRHALAAGEPDLAAIWLVESSRAFLMARQYDTLRVLCQAIDEASSSPSPIFMATWCFPVLFGSASGVEIDRVLDRARKSVLDTSEDEEKSDLWAHVPYLFHLSPAEMLRGIDATIAHRRGDLYLALATLAEQGDTPSEGGWVEGAAGELLIFAQRPTEGEALMQRFADYCLSPMNPIVSNLVYMLATQAFAKLQGGQLAEAEALAERGIEVMRTNGLDDMPHSTIAVVPLAWVAWERGELDTAEALVLSALDGLAHLGEVPPIVMAYILLARCRNSRGDPRAAVAALSEITAALGGRVPTGFLAERISFERARVALLADDLPGARIELPDWCRRTKTDAGTMLERLVLIRLVIAAGDDPTSMFESMPEDAEITQLHQIELGILRALAARRGLDDAAALDHLVAAMGIARNTGHRQVFLDDSPVFGALLDMASAQSGLVLGVQGQPVGAPGIDPKEVPVLDEPLTSREFEILRALSGHLTLREIAQEMYLSINTVKFHVKSVYSKLEVTNRSRAVEVGRALRFID